MNAEIIANLIKLEKAATPAPWGMSIEEAREAETTHCVMYADKAPGEHPGWAGSLFDTSNATAREIHDESDEDGTNYIDEVGRRNFQFIKDLRNHAASLLEIARLGMSKIELQRDLIADLAKKNEELRKIAAHVPGLIYIKAKEAAGFAEKIHAR